MNITINEFKKILDRLSNDVEKYGNSIDAVRSLTIRLDQCYKIDSIFNLGMRAEILDIEVSVR